MAPLQRVLVISRLQILGIVLGTLLDLSARQSDAERSFVPPHTTNPLRCNQNTLARQPVVHVDDKVANGPRLLFEQEVRDVTNQPIRGPNVIAHYRFAASQMSVCVRLIRSGSPLSFASSRICGSGGTTIGIAPQAQYAAYGQYRG
jgi:hypothetical protein